MHVFIVLLSLSADHGPMVRQPEPQPYGDGAMAREPSSQPFLDRGMVYSQTEPTSFPTSLPVEDDDEDDEDERIRKKMRKHARRNNVGFSVAVHGGMFLRAREPLADLGNAIGPAGAPGRLGGLFDGELVLEIGRHLRIGAAIIWSETSASGRGPDAGNIDIRQTANYRFLTGGLIVDGVIPLSSNVDMSLGATLAAGQLTVNVFSSRLDEYSDVAVDLRAIPKTQRFMLEATALHIRPAIGFRMKLGNRPMAAIDIRIGLNAYFVPKNFLRVSDEMPLQNSPEIIDLHPYLVIGIALGDFSKRN